MMALPSAFLQLLQVALLLSAVSSTVIDFDPLKLWLYSSKVVRVTYEPQIRYSTPRYNSSLIVSYDASNLSINYNVSHPYNSNNNIYHITTDDLLIIVNNETKWLGFYDINTNKSILTEPDPSSSNINGKTIVNTTDHLTNEPLYKVTQTWQLGSSSSSDSDNAGDSDSVSEALYGFGQYQNGFLNFRDTPVRCVQFNVQACIPFIISNKNYGILWDNYGVLLWNKPNIKLDWQSMESTDELSKWNNYTTALTLNNNNNNNNDDIIKNKYGFQVEMNEMYSYGVGQFKKSTNAYIELVATYTDNNNINYDYRETILKYDMLRNLPSSVEGTIFFPNNVKNVTIDLNIFGFDYPINNLTYANLKYPKLFVRYPSNFTDITSFEANYIDYYFIYGGTSTSSSSSETSKTMNVQNSQNIKTGKNTKTTKNRQKKSSSKLPNANKNRKFPENSNLHAGHKSRMDDVIAGYRLLTGVAPLYSLNVYGFWQCREHYRNQSEILNAASEFRRRQLPMDNIVQDWQYWGKLGWGPHWDPDIYPNPLEMANELHGMNVKLMVSVWSKFATNTDFYTIMKDNDWLINGSIYFNAYNYDAQTQYFQFINDSMFNNNVDYIWLDATEPENFPNKNASLLLNNPNNNVENGHNNGIIESGTYLMNPYSLFVTNAVNMGYYDSKSVLTNNKRLFTLTRSSFAGQQATRGALWSGDTTASYAVLYDQICASNNYALSGIPYWSQDIGGFFRPNDQYTSLPYRRLLIRWFQFGAFVPIFRVHGGGSHTEYWHYGETVEKYVLLIDNLRYRLLPYIYSMAYKITAESYTLQRPIVMDFSNDENIYGIIDNSTRNGISMITLYHEFMFGESLLIVPVYNDNNRTNIYLPMNTEEDLDRWYDFWTGIDYMAGLLLINEEISLDKIAIYVKSGSILVLGPFVQYSNEIPWIEMEIRIYKGNDGHFRWYEDDFEYRYSIEELKYTIIEFMWYDNNDSLVISDRQGSFNGMIDDSRIFNIVIVSENHGIGVNVTDNSKIDKTVLYDGSQQTIVF